MNKVFTLMLTVGILIAGVTLGVSDRHIYNAASSSGVGEAVRIGLYYGNNGVAYGNLQNETGAGYRFGYFESGRYFVPLGYTYETKITMLKNRNLYITNANEYVDTYPSSLKGTVGCFHIRVQQCGSFEEALEASANYHGGFPAYFDGAFYVHVGAYMSRAEADSANASLNGTVLTGSERCVTVVISGTSDIVFQFDNSEGRSLGVMPMAADGVRPVTWFRGYKYYGGFEYTRNSADTNMTVVNVVDIDDYVKGVIPYEMNPAWHIEALKAQAVCARTYVAFNRNKHRSFNFDLCSGDDCQVYMGNNRADASTDRAVDETAGLYITYNGELAEIFYHSSSGGATENSENVFTKAHPWLRGVFDDEYERLVRTGRENWSVEYSASEISSLLQSKGYAIASVVSVTPTYTAMGNMLSMRFTDSNGRNFTFERESVRLILNSRALNKFVHSQRFTIVARGQSPTYTEGETVYVAGQNSPVNPTDLRVISGSGEIASLDRGATSVISASGTMSITIDGQSERPTPVSGVTHSGNVYVIQGSGWGHNVGMSQFGARAMAESGKTYDEIIRYYFTGTNATREYTR